MSEIDQAIKSLEKALKELTSAVESDAVRFNTTAFEHDVLENTRNTLRSLIKSYKIRKQVSQ